MSSESAATKAAWYWKVKAAQQAATKARMHREHVTHSRKRAAQSAGKA